MIKKTYEEYLHLRKNEFLTDSISVQNRVYCYEYNGLYGGAHWYYTIIQTHTKH